MKAPSAGYRIFGGQGFGWEVRDKQAGDAVVWKGKSFKGARNAHYRLSVARITGKPVSAQQARRAGNA